MIMPGAMTGLSEFLLARIAEDEHAARKVSVPAGPAHGDALCSPARALYECTAKRMIVALHSISPPTPTPDPFDTPPALCAHDGTRYPCLTLRALALPYANHPSYREDWRS